VRGATAFCGAGQSFDAGSSLPPVLTFDDEPPPPLLLPLLLLSLLLLPHPATANAARSAPAHAPRRNPFIADIVLL
jgi:hypothetical protein